MAKTGYTLSESAVKRTAETVRRVLGDPIPVVKKGKGKSVIIGETGFWVMITGFTELVADARWQYTGRRVVPNKTTGEGGRFIDLDPPVTIAPIYNTCEANNIGVSVQGNSVDKDTIPSGFSIKPIRGFPVLRARAAADENNDPMYFVSYENAVDGVCP